jgi:hypothetical protein
MRRMGNGPGAAALILLLAAAGGCAAAAGAAAGAAAAIAYDERNASARVDASVSALTSATEAAFREMGVTVMHRQAGGDSEMEFHGTMSEGDVAVHIESEGGSTSTVVVTVKEGEVDYKPTIAGRILERIIARVG